MTTPGNKGGSGRFKPGQSGNPSGRPKGIAAWFQKKYGKDGQTLWLAYHAIAFDKKAPLGARLQALDQLSARGFGQPLKQVAVTVDDRSEDFKALTDADLRARMTELVDQLK
jgi:hypothetical protein